MGCTGLDLGSQQVWFGHSGKKGMSFGRSRVMAHTHCRCNLSSRDIADAIQVEAVLLVSFGTFRDVDFFFGLSHIYFFSVHLFCFFLFFFTISHHACHTFTGHFTALHCQSCC